LKPRPTLARRALPALVPALLAWLLLGALPVAAAPISLSSPAVTPASGTTETLVTFSVTYTNKRGDAPDWVRVSVADYVHTMTSIGGTPKQGLRFAVALRLPAGTHAVSFAASTQGQTTSLAAATVSIVPAPTPQPTPTPTPKATPKPTPKPTPAPTPKPTPKATPKPTPKPTPRPAPRATPAPTPKPTPKPTPREVAVVPGGGTATPRPSTAPAAPGGTPAPSSAPGGLVVPGGPEPTPPGAGSGRTDPAVAGPFGDDGMRRLVLVAATVSTGITLLVAFFLFGRRRRDEDPAHLELATAAVVAGTAYGAEPPPIPSIDPGTGGTDVDLPRWRRPSLLAARKSDPQRDGGPAVAGHLTFAGAATAEGLERRRVRYRIVRLLDRPDELTGTTVGSLDEGDEVAVVEQSGLYRRVETPDGRSGWLHKMTLGDVVEDPEDADEELDPDVLMAYLAARGRS
jgi:outer membrane biosynthesis protein TonB